ncbi:MAG: DUF485 domain-containing protein [Candidatus Latescibacteria bacterium]|nr:DUF485 domain-containing protein [Candidatus Latescibacterota bacterium]
MIDPTAAQALEELAARRWRVALTLTLAMLAIYFGFILLIAFDKELMGQLLGEGLSLGILFGALVIVSAWVLTGIYIWWANTYYDPRIRELKGQ